VQSYGWFERERSLFIAMEYLEAGDFQSYLAKCRGPLQEKEAKTISKQILEGLVFMHNEGFAHRDLKPAVGISIRASKAVSLLTSKLPQPEYPHQATARQSRKVVGQDSRFWHQQADRNW
jgi:serine/threonine protein kinase